MELRPAPAVPLSGNAVEFPSVQRVWSGPALALGLVVAGIWKRISAARWAGIVLLCVTLASTA